MNSQLKSETLGDNTNLVELHHPHRLLGNKWELGKMRKFRNSNRAPDLIIFFADFRIPDIDEVQQLRDLARNFFHVRDLM